MSLLIFSTFILYISVEYMCGSHCQSLGSTIEFHVRLKDSPISHVYNKYEYYVKTHIT